MVVNDGSHGNLGEFSHVRWIDSYISIAPRTVCRDIAWNPFIWGPLDHGVLQNVPTKPIHWSWKLVKPCKTSTSPGSIPVISPFSIHWPKSTPPGDAAPGLQLRRSFWGMEHPWFLEGMLWIPKKDAEVTVDLPLRARLRTYLNVVFVCKNSMDCAGVAAMMNLDPPKLVDHGSCQRCVIFNSSSSFEVVFCWLVNRNSPNGVW